tara:strand:- start:208 stop:417 length:210 start_codon:yes stop_codon:yes gene_type:complete
VKTKTSRRSSRLLKRQSNPAKTKKTPNEIKQSVTSKKKANMLGKARILMTEETQLKIRFTGLKQSSIGN